MVLVSSGFMAQMPLTISFPREQNGLIMFSLHKKALKGFIKIVETLLLNITTCKQMTCQCLKSSKILLS